MATARKNIGLRVRKRARATVQRVPLAGDRQIEIRRNHSSQLVQIVDGKRGPAISVRVTRDSIELLLSGASVTLRAAGTLNLEANQLCLSATHGLSLRSGGDAVIEAGGALQTSARSQSLTATLGGVRVTANDDIKLEGERILLNS
jgi:hypothetical protein